MKKRDTDPVSNQFPKCSPLSGTHRNSELGREEKREGGDRDNLVKQKESPKEEKYVHAIIQRREEGGRRQRWPGV